MAKIYIVTGSVLGTAEYTSEQITNTLVDMGHEVQQHDDDYKTTLTGENKPDLLLVCTSTTGSGQLPKPLREFHHWLTNDFPRINELKYLLVALGNSSYDEFCGGGMSLDFAFKELGMTPIVSALKIDTQYDFNPEVIAPEWVREQLENFK